MLQFEFYVVKGGATNRDMSLTETVSAHDYTVTVNFIMQKLKSKHLDFLQNCHLKLNVE